MCLEGLNISMNKWKLVEAAVNIPTGHIPNASWKVTISSNLHQFIPYSEVKSNLSEGLDSV
jgi:hypothetical protein